MSKATRRAAQRKRPIGRDTHRGRLIGLGLVLLVLMAAIIFVGRGSGPVPASPSHAAAGEESSWYRPATLQQVANIIATAEHALIYYRSPT